MGSGGFRTGLGVKERGRDFREPLWVQLGQTDFCRRGWVLKHSDYLSKGVSLDPMRETESLTVFEKVSDMTELCTSR